MEPQTNSNSPRHNLRTLASLQQKLNKCNELLESGTLTNKKSKTTDRLRKHLIEKIEKFASIKAVFINHYKNIIEAPKNRILCHCVAADLWMSKGAAGDLSKLYPGIREVQGELKVGSCLESTTQGRTFLNLITKHKSFEKPSQKDFETCILSLKRYIELHKITSISITRLGCGLDNLDWDSYVFPFLQKTFDEMPIAFHIFIK